MSTFIVNLMLLLVTHLSRQQMFSNDLVKFVPVGKCRSMDVNRTAINCKPYESVVTLPQSSDPTEKYYPRVARLKRCHGHCNRDGYSCMPLESRWIKIKVQRINFGKGQKCTTGTMAMEEHVKCSCSCMVMREDCSQLQKFDSRNCSCLCKNVEEERFCRTQDNRYWDPVSCSCKCHNTFSCSTGLTFVHELCKCLPDLSPEM